MKTKHIKNYPPPLGWLIALSLSLHCSSAVCALATGGATHRATDATWSSPTPPRRPASTEEKRCAKAAGKGRTGAGGSGASQARSRCRRLPGSG